MIELLKTICDKNKVVDVTELFILAYLKTNKKKLLLFCTFIYM